MTIESTNITKAAVGEVAICPGQSWTQIGWEFLRPRDWTPADGNGHANFNRFSANP